jgi:hypothetical protein
MNSNKILANKRFWYVCALVLLINSFAWFLSNFILQGAILVCLSGAIGILVFTNHLGVTSYHLNYHRQKDKLLQ